jgi:PAS domain S-box-containing protein
MLVWMGDAAGRVTFVNRKWLMFTGRRLKDELGDGWTAAVHPEDRDACVNLYRAALRERRPFSIEYRVHRADGVYR